MSVQKPERIYHDKVYYNLLEDPLRSYLKLAGSEVVTKASEVQDSCRRGYLGTWTIKSGRLYLTKLVSPAGEDLLPILFPGKLTPLHAQWYTGSLRFSPAVPDDWGFPEGWLVYRTRAVSGFVEEINEEIAEANRARRPIDSKKPTSAPAPGKKPQAAIAIRGAVEAESHSQLRLVAKPAPPAVAAPPRKATSTQCPIRDPDCPALLEAATPKLFSRNAFSITGLSVDATAREIKSHAKRQEMMRDVGGEMNMLDAAFGPKTPPSGEEIREAIQRINDSEKRLIEEFFWFWPERFGSSREDEALKALACGDREKALGVWEKMENSGRSRVVATHNIALLWWLLAMEWEEHAVRQTLPADRRRKIDLYWRNALHTWETLVDDDEFWETVFVRAKEMDEARLTTGFVRSMRNTLPYALDKVNAELAIEHLKQQSGSGGAARHVKDARDDQARYQVDLMRLTQKGTRGIQWAARRALAPELAVLTRAISQAATQGENSPLDAARAARQLLTASADTVRFLDCFYARDAAERTEPLDEIARTVNQLQEIHHGKTGDAAEAIRLLEMALPLASSKEVTEQIQTNLALLQAKPALEAIKAIHEALTSVSIPRRPSDLFLRFRNDVLPLLTDLKTSMQAGSIRDDVFDVAAVVLRAISVEAWNKQNHFQVAMEALALASSFATDPDLKRRISEDRQTMSASLPRGMTIEKFLEIRARTKYLPDESDVWNWKACVIALISITAIFVFANLAGEGRLPWQNSYEKNGFSTEPKSNAGGKEIPQIAETSSTKNSLTKSGVSDLGSIGQPSVVPKLDKSSDSINWVARKFQSGGTVPCDESRYYQIPLSKATVLDGIESDILRLREVAHSSSQRAKPLVDEVKRESEYLAALRGSIEEVDGEIQRMRANLNNSNYLSVSKYNNEIKKYNALVQAAETKEVIMNAKTFRRNKAMEEAERDAVALVKKIDEYNNIIRIYGK